MTIKNPLQKQRVVLRQKDVIAYSHSIINEHIKLLIVAVFFKPFNFSTVFYTVTGKQYRFSGSRIAVRRVVRLLLPGQRILPVVDFVREIC